MFSHRRKGSSHSKKCSIASAVRQFKNKRIDLIFAKQSHPRVLVTRYIASSLPRKSCAYYGIVRTD